MKPTPYIRTFSGRNFEFLNPKEDRITIEDIAHALGSVCRFGGHSLEFISVAQHSVLVSRIVPKSLALWGLLHDAHEAYLTDIPTPIKQFLPQYYEMATGVQNIICDKFQIPRSEPPEVKEADREALINESIAFMPNSEGWLGCRADCKYLPMRSWNPAEAKDLFLARFWEITHGKQLKLSFNVDNG